MQKEIYLDNAATTQTHPLVAEEAVKAMTLCYGNPSSLHQLGLDSQLLFEKAQKQVASLLGGKGESVIFTSGGTESNNLAIFGAAYARRRSGNKIITTAYEHASVLGPFEELMLREFRPAFVLPKKDGSFEMQRLLDCVDEDTILVSVMAVNNEVGTLLPVAELATAVKRINPNTLVHCDGVQAFGKIPFEIEKSDIDMISVSGHKIHAPKGVGALYVKKGIRLQPLLFGGAQQKGVRPGTENLPLAVAMGKAAEMAKATMGARWAHAKELNVYLRQGLQGLQGAQINSPEADLCSPYILNCSFPGYPSEVLLHFLEERGIYVSSASACTKGAKSHVLEAMGLSGERIDSALRISMQESTTQEDLDALLQGLADALQKIKTKR